MKKFIKVFSSLCLVLVVGVAVLLSGCTKKFNVNISATAGGEILQQATNSKSLIGDNEVEQGKDFSLVISANPGYYIAKVTVNGKAVDMTDWELDGYSVPTYHIYAVKNVQADVKVVVTFEAIPQAGNLTFRANSSSGDVIATYYNIPCFKLFSVASLSDYKVMQTNGLVVSANIVLQRAGDGTLVVKNADDSNITDTAAVKALLDTLFAGYTA